MGLDIHMIMSLWRKLSVSRSWYKLSGRTHSDTTLSLLRRGGGVSEEEESVLAPWEWNHNEAYLHWDDRVSWLSPSTTLANHIAYAREKKGILR
jgi:hypothetical protein